MISGNRRIAYNSIILYAKLVLSILVGLYTSRLILIALGDSDFGLYSVVGGVVTLMNVIGVTMGAISFRFISVEIGKGEKGDSNKAYNTVLTIHIILAVLLLVIGLIVGLWYVNNHLNTSYDKLSDARFVLIVSILTTVINVVATPGNGLIIAREKFLFLAVVESVQLILKLLLIVYVLVPYGGNRLRLYASLAAGVAVIAPLAYLVYCWMFEREITRWKLNHCLKEYKSVCSFAGWLLLSTFSFMAIAQGSAVIMNHFFGTVINAGFAIALQVQTYLMMFPKNILQATSPQIIKSFGEGNEDRALSLVYSSTKYCFFIFLFLAIPFLLFVDEVLCLWLGNVPEYASVFTSFLIISSVIGSLTNGFDPLVLAIGKIRMMEIGYGVTNLIQLPIMYCLYTWGFPAYSNTIVMVFMAFVSIVYQTYVVNRVSDFKVADYIKRTINPVSKVVLLLLPLFYLRTLIYEVSFTQLSLCVLLTIIWLGIIIYFVGMTHHERISVIGMVTHKTV